jgi:hypothetical protein
LAAPFSSAAKDGAIRASISKTGITAFLMGKA